MSQVIYLRSSTISDLIEQARANGFNLPDIPEKGYKSVKKHARFIYKGTIVDQKATYEYEYDEEGNVTSETLLTPETYKSGFHADLILTCHHTAEEFDFGDMVAQVETPENEYGV